MNLSTLLNEFIPGSYEQPWTWTDEVIDLLKAPCRCCDQPGHYQYQLIQHIKAHGIPGGVILGNDGRVWDGHHRIAAAILLGINEIPVADDWRGHVIPRD